MSSARRSEDARDDGPPSFEDFARGVRAKVEARLEEILIDRVRDAETHGHDVHALTHAVSDLTRRGGKRLRAALAMVGYVACGGHGEEPAVIDAGAALELLQTYLLVHDDWMDGDTVRRGGPSVHAMLRQHFGDDAKGDASAILAGDYACALAQETLARAPASPLTLVRALAFFARMQADAIYGQQLDIAARAEDVEQMHDLKTGSYTVRGPLVLGGMLADATNGQLRALTAYARPLGVAFQLRDDLLGAFGETEVTGKPYGNDLRAGKKTALVDEAETRLDAEGREVVARAFGLRKTEPRRKSP